MGRSILLQINVFGLYKINYWKTQLIVVAKYLARTCYSCRICYSYNYTAATSTIITILRRYNASLHLARVEYEPKLPYTVRSKTATTLLWGKQLENTLIKQSDQPQNVAFMGAQKTLRYIINSLVFIFNERQNKQCWFLVFMDTMTRVITSDHCNSSKGSGICWHCCCFCTAASVKIRIK